nr:reverse transcriptase domain-containing protein [Tanacetum cinerariifolium]
EMLDIYPRIPGQAFAKLPFEEEILEFIRFLGHGTPRPTKSTMLVLLEKQHLSQRLVPKGKRSGSDTSITPPTATTAPTTTVAISPRLTTATKGKQPAKVKSTSDPSEVARTEAQQLKIVLRRSRQQTHISQLGGSGTDEGTGSKPGVPDVPSDDSEEEISWNSFDDEDVDDQTKGRDDKEGEKTDESDDDDDDDDDDQDEAKKVNDDDDDEEEISKIDKQEATESGEGNDEENESDGEGEEEETREEAEESFDPIPKLLKTVRMMVMVRRIKGRGLQVSQVIEDSHVTLNLVHSDGQQESSSTSSFVTSLLNPIIDLGMESIFTTGSSFVTPIPSPKSTMTPSIITTTTTASQPPIPPTPLPSEVLQNLLTFESVFRFEDRVKSLEVNFSEFMRTNQSLEAISNIPVDLSEMELKKILIDKMEGNNEEEETREQEEESFDPIPRTPKDGEDDGDGKEDQGLRISVEERMQEEEEADELYRMEYIFTTGSSTVTPIPSPKSTMTPSIMKTTTIASQPPTPPTPIPSIDLQNLPTFTSVFRFKDRVKSLEVNFSEFMRTNQSTEAVSNIPGLVHQYIHHEMPKAVREAVQIQTDRLQDSLQRENDEFLRTIDDNMKKIIKEQVKNQVKAQVTRILPRIEESMNAQLEVEVLTRSSHSSRTLYAVVADLSEMEQKKILIDKMEGNKSIKQSDEQRNLYKALVEAYDVDKTILDSYGESSILKRRRKDDDDQEGPSAGSDRGESAFEEEPVQTTCQMEEPSNPVFETGNAQSWISALAKQTDARSSFNELLDTPIDFSNFIMNRLDVDTLTPELLAGPTYELMRGSCNSLTELEYHLEEVNKAMTDQLDWVNPEGQQYPHNLLQPLLLIPDNRGRRVIPFEHFINNDLEYLWGGASSRKYTTSVPKIKAADYRHIKWIEDLVPLTMWIQEPLSYDKHALWGVSHWGRKRQQFYGIVKWHNYKHLDWISVRRDDEKIYKFKEGDFKRLRLQDIEDMLLLLVQGRLSNLTVEKRFAFNVSLRMLTRSIVIQRHVEDLQLGVKSYQKRLNLTNPDTLLRIDKLHKFSDGMLNDVRNALDDRLKGIRMQYLPTTIWRKGDKDRVGAMIQAIDKMLKTRRIMRSLERRSNYPKKQQVVPLEFALVSGLEKTLPTTEQILEERVNVAIKLEYPKQTVMIGFTLTEGGRNKLCGLLQHNLDIFAWKLADITRVLRHIAKHCLNLPTSVDKAFHKHIGRNLKVYVDDLVIKSNTKYEIVRNIEKLFKTLKEINMKLNPKKCTFGVEEGMFLGYKIYTKGLKVCPYKVDDVLSLPSPKCLKDVQKLNEKLASLNTFLAKSPEKSLQPRVSVKWQILADFIVERPEEDSLDTLMELEEELPEPWILFTDGSSFTDGSGARLILTNPEGMEFTYALRFRFDAINNEAKYEALISGLRIAEQMTIPRSENKKADALRKIASTSFANLSKQIVVEEMKKKSISEVEIPAIVEEEGDTWMTSIFEYLMEETLPADVKKARAIRRKSQRFAIINGTLYKRSFLGPWLWCIGPLQANYVLKEIHKGSCSMHAGTRSVMAKSLRIGYYCPTMHKDAMLLIRAHQDCQDHKPILRNLNGDTPFSLTYEMKALIPSKINMPTLRASEVDLVQNDEALGINLDLLKEKREQAAIREAKSKAKMEMYYNSKVQSASFKSRDLVYCNNDASYTEDTGKLGPRLEGPYEVTEALRKGAYKLRDPDGKKLLQT